MNSRFFIISFVVSLLLMLSGCTQETQNKIGRAMQNWTGTNGVLDIYEGEKLAMRFIKIDKLSTAKGTDDGTLRQYRYGYGYIDKNFNYKVDDGEKKLYFEIAILHITSFMKILNIKRFICAKIRYY